MRNKNGFTLVELMLYMALMASILVVLTEVFLSVLSLQAESSGVADVDADGRFILARLFYDVNRASAVAVPGSLGATASSAQLTIDGTSYTYSVDANGVFSVLGNSETNNLTSPQSRVSELSFTRLGNAGGENSLQIKFKIKSGKESRDFQTTVALR